MAEVSFIITCYNDKRHQIPVVLKVDDKNPAGQNTKIEIQCPICGAWNVAETGYRIDPDGSALRGLKKAD